MTFQRKEGQYDVFSLSVKNIYTHTHSPVLFGNKVPIRFASLDGVVGAKGSKMKEFETKLVPSKVWLECRVKQ